MSWHRHRFTLYALEDGDEYLGDIAAEYSVALNATTAPTSTALSVAALQRAMDAAPQKTATKLAAGVWSISQSAFVSMLGSSLLLQDASSRRPVAPPAVRGRLRLSGRCLFFDPDDSELPVLTWRFNAAFSAQRLDATAASGDSTLMAIRTPSVAMQLSRGKQHAHVVDSTASSVVDHVFAIQGASARNFLGRFNTMNALAQIGSDRNRQQERDEALDAIHRANSVATPFSYSWLSSPLETVDLQVDCSRIAPLRRQRGRFIITTRCVYFQATFPLDSTVPVEVYPIAHLRRLAKRRVDFDDRGCELALQLPRHEMKRRTAATTSSTSASVGAGDNADGASTEATYVVLMFDFDSSSARDAAVASIRKSADSVTPRPEGLLASLDMSLSDRVDAMRELWCDGNVSTLDYLMFLNWAAGRTFADLAQYAVLPWVIADYTSRELDLGNALTFRDLALPIGALNSARLKGFQQRAEELRLMQETPYLYGSHYSNPAYVTFWLLRERPEFMLSLHSGKFDHPARIFDSIPASWSSVINGPTDLKELVPQFFLGTGRFLTADASSIEFRDIGVKPDGTKPRENVELPPWASSPSDFVKKNRDALECEYVSQRIHRWIDLVFGYAQQGPEAWKANNVFHPHSYEGSRESVSFKDETDRQAFTAHIREFGQVPAQLFTTPHPPRRVGATRPELIRMDTFLSIASDAATKGPASPLTPTTVTPTTRSPTSGPAAAPVAGNSFVEPTFQTVEGPQGGNTGAIWGQCNGLSSAWECVKVCANAVKAIAVLPASADGEPPTAVVSDGTGSLMLWPISALQRRGQSVAIARDGAAALVNLFNVDAVGSSGPSVTVVTRSGLVGVLPLATTSGASASASRPPVSMIMPLEVTQSVLICASIVHGPRGASAVAVGSRDGTLRVVPLESGAPLMAAKKVSSSGLQLQWDLESSVNFVAWSPNGCHLYALNEDGGLFAVGAPSESTSWRPVSGVSVPPIAGVGSLECVQLPSAAADGVDEVQLLAANDDGTVVIVSKRRITLVAMTDDATHSVGDVIRTVDICDALGAESISALQRLPDGVTVAVGTTDGIVACIDSKSWKPRRNVLLRLAGRPAITCIVPMGSSLIVGDATGNVHCVNAVQ